MIGSQDEAAAQQEQGRNFGRITGTIFLVIYSVILIGIT